MGIGTLAYIATWVSMSSCAHAHTHVLKTGDLTLTIDAAGKYTLEVAGLPVVRSHFLSVFVENKARTVQNKGLDCPDDAAASTPGTDKYGTYTAVELKCAAGATSATAVPVVFSWRAYAVEASAAPAGAAAVGKIVYSLTLPLGANGTQADHPGLAPGAMVAAPTQVAPFPAFQIGGAFATAGLLCYGGR